MRNLKKRFDAIVFHPEDARKYAERTLAKLPKATLLLSTLNGADLFIKDENGTRVSTQKEWDDYFSE